MKVVADTKELFSFFNRRSLARDLSLSEELDIYSPVYALEELEKHKGKTLEVFSLSSEQYDLILRLLHTVVVFVELKEYAEHLKEGKDISPDPDDADFFALALKLSCPLWSEDKKLAEQGKVKVIATSELTGLM